MSRRTDIALRTSAVSVAALVAGALAAGPAAAAGGDVQVVNTETVQVYTSPTGKVESKRIYEQLSLTGNGRVELSNPVAIEGLRNLDGFGGLDVKDGNQVIKLDVDGKQRLRSVSDYKGELPLDVKVEYSLDGKSVEPSDVVGKSGKLAVRYTVKNVTGQKQELTFPDGNGGTVTKTVEVPIPLVGTLTTIAPSSFTDVESDAANMAGDGKGGTKVSFTMTLFPPVGSDTAEFGYTAQITDGVVPRTSIQALPVNPLESPTFKTAATSYKGGAETGAELADGAGQIDTNLLKLRDGAGDLLAGLIKLHDGAEQLNDGLAGKAAPGSKTLADGADALNDGLGKLDKGAGELSAGSTAAHSGSQQLTDGLAQISGGLSQLADAKEGLPKAQDGIERLATGVDLLLAGLGNDKDDKTLIGGLAKLESGMGLLGAGAGDLEGGLRLLDGQFPDTSLGLPGAKGGVDGVKAGLDKALVADGSVNGLIRGLGALRDMKVCAGNPVCDKILSDLLAGAQQSKDDLTQASAVLGQVSGGLNTAILGLEGKLIPGAQTLKVKLGEAQTGAGDLKKGALTLAGGLEQVRGGLSDLETGVTKAVGGVLQLSNGAQDAHGGSADLTDGLGRLQDGAGRLADGATQAHDGSSQLADGADDLADGLGDAAEGSGKLAAGLGEAEAGAPALPNGAQRLSDEGSKKLVEAGEATAQNYGEMYAVIEAGAKRADTEKMINGAPAHAIGLAAYSYEIKGEDGESNRNLARGLGGLALLAVAGGAAFLRRRVFA